MLVEYNPERETIADLAQLTNAEVVVAVLPNLGTLNQTALTIEALEQRDLRLAGVVIGRWPKQPDMICTNNIVDLETIAKRPLSGAIRERAGHLSKPEFLSAADSKPIPGLRRAFRCGRLSAAIRISEESVTMDILARAREQVLEKGEGLSESETLEILELPDDRIPEALALAHEVRMRWCGPGSRS